MKKPKSKNAKKAQKFTKQTAVILIIALVVVGSAVWAVSYFFMFDRTEALRQAVVGNGSVSCTITPTDGQEGIRLYASQNGVLFAREGLEISHNFAAVPDTDEPVTVYILHKDDTEYIWSEGGTQGIKVDISANENRISEVAKDKEKFNQEMAGSDVSCRRGTNSARLQVPEDVDFKSMEELLSIYYGTAPQSAEENGQEHEDGDED